MTQTRDGYYWLGSDDGLARFDGVRFVALAPIGDPGLVIATIAHALGVMEAGGQPLIESVKNYLRDRQMLLVLDNFEQVVSAVPQVVGLLKSCPDLAVLVTSRAALHVGGEREFAPVLARAAAAVGVAAMFIETHQDPDRAPCEGPTMVPLKSLPSLLETLIAFDRLAKTLPGNAGQPAQ